MHEIYPRESALVLIDLANDFLYPGGVIADAGGPEYQKRAQSIIPVLKRLVEAAREAGVLVVYATDEHTPEDSELAKWPPHSMKGTEWSEVTEELRPQPGDLVIGKTTYSPFVSTEIDAELKKRGIRRLYITGLHTDCCARHTSGDAFQRGYDLVWVTDGLQAFSDEAHRTGLEYFSAWYATDATRQLKTAQEVVSEWSTAGVT
ncbi:MAG TPA: isochorismatase family cysteine hydrolase [Gemmatimonadales bacterium]|nr:isochorismatase family cysteine hydrolase [Gemmatimonadales bacterium]